MYEKLELILLDKNMYKNSAEKLYILNKIEKKERKCLQKVVLNDYIYI